MGALVEFRAGKMSVATNDGKTMVTADKRKGMIQVEQGDDDLMHFKWKDRTSGTVEDDLIIFPDDIDFLKVDQCKTGRVYVLKFKSSSRRMFFWMQEPKDDKDEELCKKVNDSLNKPLASAREVILPPAPSTLRSKAPSSSRPWQCSPAASSRVSWPRSSGSLTWETRPWRQPSRAASKLSSRPSRRRTRSNRMTRSPAKMPAMTRWAAWTEIIQLESSKQLSS